MPQIRDRRRTAGAARDRVDAVKSPAAALGVLAVLMLVEVLVLLRAGRGLTFYLDEWTIPIQRSA